jgi:hypothetical protein
MIGNVMFRRENVEAGKVLRCISLLRCYYIAKHKILTCSTELDGFFIFYTVEEIGWKNPSL